ncbi:MAG: transglycosylase domain-containing protein, partial [Bacteroidales bacterium]|nr:transglycosylase domain-containing protein [Bacteroidales bacterium]
MTVQDSVQLKSFSYRLYYFWLILFRHTNVAKISLSLRKNIHILIGIVAAVALLALALRPGPLFDNPVSAVLESSDGRLLSARIAADGQWRFPASDSVPEKFARAIVRFEDKRFWRHPGVDPLALARAMKLNLSSGEVRSGGSTITMQTIRLSRDNPPRTIVEKLWEMILALRLELYTSKKDIL